MSEGDSRSRSTSSADDVENGDSGSRERRGEKRKYDGRSQRSSGKRSADCRVYVSNIPYEFKWQDLKDLFRAEVGNVAYVEMFNDDSGKPRGSAIVDFETADLAKDAIEKMHRREAKGRKLVVKVRDDVVHSRDFMFLFNKGMDRDRNRFGKDMDRGGSFNRNENNFQNNNIQNNNMPSQINFGNTFGLSISFLTSLGINGPLGKRVFVANLDYKVKDDDLKEAFKVAGSVANAEVIKDSDGKSRGFGVVEYEHPVQAVQAISMLHNQQFFDRRINVRLDKVTDKKIKSGSNTKLPPGLKGLGMGLGANGEAITDVSGLASNLHVSNSNSQMGMGGGGGGGGGFNMSGGGNMPTGVNPSHPVMGMGGMDNMGMGSNLGLGGLGANNVLNLATALSTMASATGFGNQGMNLPSNAPGPMFNNNNNSSNNFGHQSSSNEFNSNFSNTNRTIVRVSNLPVDYTWKNLKDMCRNLGDIRFAEIKSKGVGLVRFSSEAEARRTVDMLDRQRFDGRVLDANIV